MSNESNREESCVRNLRGLHDRGGFGGANRTMCYCFSMNHPYRFRINSFRNRFIMGAQCLLTYPRIAPVKKASAHKKAPSPLEVMIVVFMRMRSAESAPLITSLVRRVSWHNIAVSTIKT